MNCDDHYPAWNAQFISFVPAVKWQLTTTVTKCFVHTAGPKCISWFSLSSSSRVFWTFGLIIVWNLNISRWRCIQMNSPTEYGNKFVARESSFMIYVGKFQEPRTCTINSYFFLVKNHYLFFTESLSKSTVTSILDFTSVYRRVNTITRRDERLV